MRLGPNLVPINVTIPNGTAVTSVIDTMGFPLAGVLMPSAWTAANLTMDAAPDAAANVAAVYDDAGTEVTLTAAASRFIAVSPSKLSGVQFLRMRSGTAGTPVNQGADRALVLVLREV